MRAANIYLPLSPSTEGFYVISNGEDCFFYGHAKDLQLEIQGQYVLKPSRRAVMLLIGTERNAAFLEEACAMRFEKVSRGHSRVIIGWKAQSVITIIKGIIHACQLDFMYVHPDCLAEFYDEIIYDEEEGGQGVQVPFGRNGDVNGCITQ